MPHMFITSNFNELWNMIEKFLWVENEVLFCTSMMIILIEDPLRILSYKLLIDQKMIMKTISFIFFDDYEWLKSFRWLLNIKFYRLIWLSYILLLYPYFSISWFATIEINSLFIFELEGQIRRLKSEYKEHIFLSYTLFKFVFMIHS